MFLPGFDRPSTTVRRPFNQEHLWQVLLGFEGICIRTQRRVAPCSADEGLGPIQRRMNGEPEGVHISDDRKCLAMTVRSSPYIAGKN